MAKAAKKKAPRKRAAKKKPTLKSRAKKAGRKIKKGAKTDVGRAGIGAGAGAILLGPIGAAVGAYAGLKTKKKSTKGNPGMVLVRSKRKPRKPPRKTMMRSIYKMDAALRNINEASLRKIHRDHKKAYEFLERRDINEEIAPRNKMYRSVSRLHSALAEKVPHMAHANPEPMVKVSSTMGSLLLDYHKASKHIEHVAASALRGEKVALSHVIKSRDKLAGMQKIQPMASEKEQIGNLVVALDKIVARERKRNPGYRAFSLETQLKRQRQSKAKKAMGRSSSHSKVASEISRKSMKRKIEAATNPKGTVRKKGKFHKSYTPTAEEARAFERKYGKGTLLDKLTTKFRKARDRWLMVAQRSHSTPGEIARAKKKADDAEAKLVLYASTVGIDPKDFETYMEHALTQEAVAKTKRRAPNPERDIHGVSRRVESAEEWRGHGPVRHLQSHIHSGTPEWGRIERRGGRGRGRDKREATLYGAVFYMSGQKKPVAISTIRRRFGARKKWDSDSWGKIDARLVSEGYAKYLFPDKADPDKRRRSGPLKRSRGGTPTPTTRRLRLTHVDPDRIQLTAKGVKLAKRMRADLERETPEEREWEQHILRPNPGLAGNPLKLVTERTPDKKFREAISRNIAVEMHAGKPQKQAIAIAMRTARKQAPVKTRKLYGRAPISNPTPNPCIGLHFHGKDADELMEAAEKSAKRQQKAVKGRKSNPKPKSHEVKTVRMRREKLAKMSDQEVIAYHEEWKNKLKESKDPEWEFGKFGLRMVKGSIKDSKAEMDSRGLKSKKKNPKKNAGMRWERAAERDRTRGERSYGHEPSISVVEMAKWTHSPEAELRTPTARVRYIANAVRTRMVHSTPAQFRKAKAIALKESLEKNPNGNTVTATVFKVGKRPKKVKSVWSATEIAATVGGTKREFVSVGDDGYMVFAKKPDYQGKRNDEATTTAGKKGHRPEIFGTAVLVPPSHRDEAFNASVGRLSRYGESRTERNPRKRKPNPSKLEGPFTFASGRVVYYDPGEGKYYDRSTDLYLSESEVESMQSGSKRRAKKNPSGLTVSRSPRSADVATQKDAQDFILIETADDRQGYDMGTKRDALRKRWWGNKVVFDKAYSDMRKRGIIVTKDGNIVITRVGQQALLSAHKSEEDEEGEGFRTPRPWSAPLRNPKRKKKATKKKATKKKATKKKTPPYQLLINRCQKLWTHYCERPSKKRLEALYVHLDKMKSSTSQKAKTERSRCLRAANAEAKKLKYKRKK